MAEMVRTETTACPMCRHTEHSLLYATRDRLYGVPGEFRLVRCNHCGLVYLNPRPVLEAIGECYPKGYDPFMLQRLDDMPRLLRLSVRYGLRKRCRLVHRYRARGRLLDVGCATGQFLGEMAGYPGWEVAGVEPSEPAADFARRTYGIPVHQGDLASARFPNGTFDVVTLWDVIEHLHDPLSVLAEVQRILAPNGFVILRTPSLDSWDARVFGPFWGHLDSPRHLVLFSRRTATALLRKGSFRVCRYHTGSGSFIGLLLSVRCWSAEAIEYPLVRRAIARLFDNPLARVLLGLPLAIGDALGLGSEMVVVAQSNTSTQEPKETPS